MMLTAPSRPAYHQHTTPPPLLAATAQLGARGELTSLRQPASHPGRVRPGADIQRASDTIFTAFKTSTEEAVKESRSRRRREEEERGAEDQKENRQPM